jgi:hypothetical protein
MQSVNEGALILRLPSPHDGCAQAFRQWKKQGGDMHWQLRQTLQDLGCYDRASQKYSAPPVPWIAEIIDNDRVFVRGQWEYPDSPGVGEDDVWIQFVLLPGKTYEINEVVPKGRSKKLTRMVDVKRFKATVINGKLINV